MGAGEVIKGVAQKLAKDACRGAGPVDDEIDPLSLIVNAVHACPPVLAAVSAGGAGNPPTACS